MSRGAIAADLAHTLAGREVVQDFVLLADSLEWHLGRQTQRHQQESLLLIDLINKYAKDRVTAQLAVGTARV